MRIWGNAKDLAAKTPESRNRYVDFLRAASILVVVIGHWLIATVYYQNGSIEPGSGFSLWLPAHETFLTGTRGRLPAECGTPATVFVRTRQERPMRSWDQTEILRRT